MLEPFKDKEGIILLLVVTIVAGAVYWSVPYGEVNFFGTQFLITWGIIAIVGGFLGVQFLRKSTRHSAVIVSTGFLLAVLMRIIVEGIQDPTSHNLFPFEIFITMILSFPPALIGSWLANYLIRE